MSIRPRNHIHIAGAVLLGAILCSRPAVAGPYINVEAVTDFSGNPGWSNLPQAVADADGFIFGQTTSFWNFAGYLWGQRYIQNAVVTTDFYDPQGTGCVGGGFWCHDQDYLYFDKAGTAFSWVTAHGNTSVADSHSQFCTSGTQCNSPIAGSTMPGFCRRMPGDFFGDCSYTKPEHAIVVGNAGSGPPRNGHIHYGPNTWVKWGESPTSGGWAGAGTNGGTNAVILAISHAEMSNRNHELWGALAGAHMLMTVLGHAGDTNTTPNRGAAFSLGYAVNPYSSVWDSWLDAVPTMSPTADGSPCYNPNTGLAYGGGRGYNGCGGHAVSTIDVNYPSALTHVYEDWYTIQNDYLDATGTGWYISHYSCNYDCWTWTFGL